MVIEIGIEIIVVIGIGVWNEIVGSDVMMVIWIMVVEIVGGVIVV